MKCIGGYYWINHAFWISKLKIVIEYLWDYCAALCEHRISWMPEFLLNSYWWKLKRSEEVVVFENRSSSNSIRKYSYVCNVWPYCHLLVNWERAHLSSDWTHLNMILFSLLFFFFCSSFLQTSILLVPDSADMMSLVTRPSWLTPPSRAWASSTSSSWSSRLQIIHLLSKTTWSCSLDVKDKVSSDLTNLFKTIHIVE